MRYPARTRRRGREATVADKGKGSKTAPKKAAKAGKHGLRPHEQRGQADAAPAGKKAGT
jgi:hypothetical protein